MGVDLDRPHAGLVVGKRGAGKSYTLGVLAEELAAVDGVTPIVLDPLDAFAGLEPCGFDTREPRVRASSLDPPAWCDLLGLEPTGSVGSLLWRAASERGSLAGIRSFVDDAEVPASTARAARNHLDLAASWGVFDPEGLGPASLADGRATVLDCAGLDRAAANAVVRAVAATLYRTAVERDAGPLPWLLVDEAHAFDGVAAPALRTLLTRGRAPGASLVLATQRPSALPAREVATSQADLLVAHRLTARRDLEALADARPTYLRESLAERLGAFGRPGEAVVVDDASETATAIRVRERTTPHDGASPRASRRATGVRND